MLPERRKSAEEIAKLREAMGIPGAAPGEQEPAAAPPPPAPKPPVSAPAVVAPPAAAAAGIPVKKKGPAPASAPVPDESPAMSPEGPLSNAADDKVTLPPPRAPKAVRSLRKSEQGIVEPAAPRSSGGVLPSHRRSEEELMELRRRQAAPPDQSIAFVRNLAAPWQVVVLGYLLPLSGALIGWLSVWTPTVHEPDFPAMWMADLSRKPWLGTAGQAALISLCVIGLLLATWISWKKPRSRHHAGFITIISVFTVVFAIISKLSPDHGP